MASEFNFVFDRFVDGLPYPNLAPMQDLSQGYKDLGHNWPNVVPLRLLYYVKDHDFKTNVYNLDQSWPSGSFYPVGIGFFNFSVDYIELLNPKVKDRIRQGDLRLLFYYHEGDNPFHEKQRLDRLCEQHNIPKTYLFVSGNTQARNLENFVYFADHELFYWKANKKVAPQAIHSLPRGKDFTLLSRTHKWWRATVVAHLHQLGLLDNSYWSYHTVDCGDQYCDNPLQIFKIPELESYIAEFLQGAPYSCDGLNSTEQNQHHTHIDYFFNNSYCHLVLETFFDADQSNGSFLTEKTFKPIKHGQPFVMFGPVDSLKTLNELGYRTFESVIDSSYDQIEHNTDRFLSAVEKVKLIYQDSKKIFDSCRDDVVYNQQLFVSSKWDRLNNLCQQLNQ